MMTSNQQVILMYGYINKHSHVIVSQSTIMFHVSELNSVTVTAKQLAAQSFTYVSDHLTHFFIYLTCSYDCIIPLLKNKGL